MPTSFDPSPLIPMAEGIPGPWGVLAILLFITFVLHLLLVNAVVGTAFITLCDWLRPTRSRAREAELELCGSLLPKGVAFLVNFAIPPFLILQGLYGAFVYSSSILMGVWWLALMGLVMLAYYGMYLNMTERGLSRGERVLALGISLALLLACSFLLVNNMTLMQRPERWEAYALMAGGLLLNTDDPQLLPRWLHVLTASLAVGGLCVAVPAELRLRAADAAPETRSYRQGRVFTGLRWFFFATLAQLPLGAWFLCALPKAQQGLFVGGDALATVLFFSALALSGAALLAALRGRAVMTACLELAVITCMAGMRFLLRSSLISPWYKPTVLPAESSAVLLFGGSALVSAWILYRLVLVYLKASPEGATPFAESGTPLVPLVPCAPGTPCVEVKGGRPAGTLPSMPFDEINSRETPDDGGPDRRNA